MEAMALVALCGGRSGYLAEAGIQDVTGRNPEIFLYSYGILVLLSIYNSIILASHALHISIIAVYRGLLLLGGSRWTSVLSIPDLSLESPSYIAASI